MKNLFLNLFLGSLVIKLIFGLQIKFDNIQISNNIVGELSNYKFNYYFTFLDINLLFNHKMTIELPPNTKNEDMQMINCILTIDGIFMAKSFQTFLKNNKLEIFMFSLLNRENKLNIKKIFIKKDHDQRFSIVLSLIDIYNPNEIQNNKINFDITSISNNSFNNRHMFTLDLSDVNVIKFNYFFECGFIINGFYSSPIKIYTNENIDEEIDFKIIS